MSLDNIKYNKDTVHNVQWKLLNAIEIDLCQAMSCHAIRIAFIFLLYYSVFVINIFCKAENSIITSMHDPPIKVFHFQLITGAITVGITDQVVHFHRQALAGTVYRR